MPTASEILAGLAAAANSYWSVAALWHGALGLVLLATAVGWRPMPRTIALMATLPLGSVAAVALAEGNPFNATVCSLLTVTLTVGIMAAPPAPPAHAKRPRWARWIGMTMLVYAATYPHFLMDGWPAYLYAAPMGIVPCPTLALLVGATLLASITSRIWLTVTFAAAIFYSLFGMLRLGVYLDAGLLLGGLALLPPMRGAKDAEGTEMSQRKSVAEGPHTASRGPRSARD